MANELKVSFMAGRTVYAMILNATGQFWNTVSGAFEAYTTANLAQYVVSLTNVGTGPSTFYLGNFPAAIPAGTYDIVAKQQIGGGPAETDPTLGTEDGFGWNGSSRVGFADTASASTVNNLFPNRIARGTMVKNFPIYLRSAADHATPLTSGTVSGQIARDGGAFGPLQSGAFTEQGQGFYNLQALTSGDLLANTVDLLFTAVGPSGGNADPVPLAFVLQRTSGQ